MEQRELYLLRRHFNISATEALNVLPAWEVDLLIAGLSAEFASAEEPVVAQPTRALSRPDPHQLAKELEHLG